MADDGLFPDDGLRAAAAEPVADERTAGQKMRDRQQARISLGRHPLGDTIPLHPDAPRDAHKDDARKYPTCGTCVHRQMVGGHARDFPKCLIGYAQRDLTPEEIAANKGTIREHARRQTTMGPRFSMSATSDVKAWWPACSDYEPKERRTARCKHCVATIEEYKGRWWTGDDFMCADGEGEHEPQETPDA